VVISIQKAEVNFHGAKIKRGAPGRQFSHGATARDDLVLALSTQKSCIVPNEEHVVGDHDRC
jgi:hypothetical protein